MTTILRSRTASTRSKRACGCSGSRQMTTWLNINMDRHRSGAWLVFCRATFRPLPLFRSPTPLGWRSLEGAGFVQDAMRCGPPELRIGFRFESTNGWNEAHGRGSNYLFRRNGVIETDPRIGTSALRRITPSSCQSRVLGSHGIRLEKARP